VFQKTKILIKKFKQDFTLRNSDVYDTALYKSTFTYLLILTYLRHSMPGVPRTFFKTPPGYSTSVI